MSQAMESHEESGQVTWYDIMSVSRSMIQLAKQGNWDVFAAMIMKRDHLLAQYFSNNENQTSPHLQNTVKNIEDLLKLNTDLMDMTKSALAEVEAKIKKLRQGQLAQQTYGDQSHQP